MVHTPRGRVSRRRRAAAITVLAEIATDPNAPAHARATAARTLVLDDPAEVDREPEDEAISTYVILPSNGRDACVRYGLYAEGQSIVIVPPGFPPEIQPESHYAHVPKPPGVHAKRAARAAALALPAPEGEP